MRLPGRLFSKQPAGRAGASGCATAFLAACLLAAPIDNSASAAEAGADALRAEILDLQVSFTGLARRVRNHELALSSAEDSLLRLEQEEAAKLQALARQRVDHYHTLAALQRIALHPRKAVAVTPEAPVDALRGALLLKAAVPALDARARELRLALEELDALRRAIEEERRTLATAAVALEQRRQEVAHLITRKKGVLAVTQAEQERASARAATLARQAADLRELMALAASEEGQRAEDAGVGDLGDLALESEESAEEVDALAGAAATGETQIAALQRPDTIREFPAEPGQILLPVLGDIVQRYGEPLPAGSGQGGNLKGIKIRSRAGAEVIAPFDGKVVFAGDFRTYGQILIIDHGGRYHSLLAGLHRIRAVVGQWVLAGEPVATMNSQDGQEPELYLELRQTGQPINPLPWLAEGEQRARG